jgi:hypothetical protein
MSGKEQVIIEIAAVLRQTPTAFCRGLLTSLRDQLPSLRMTEEDRHFEEDTYLGDAGSPN